MRNEQEAALRRWKDIAGGVCVVHTGCPIGCTSFADLTLSQPKLDEKSMVENWEIPAVDSRDVLQVGELKFYLQDLIVCISYWTLNICIPILISRRETLCSCKKMRRLRIFLDGLNFGATDKP